MKISDLIYLKEKLELVNWDTYTKLVSDAYMAAPVFEQEAVSSFKAMIEASDRFFTKVKSKVKVEFVSGDPYNSAEQMRKEVKATGVLKVMTDYSEHPIMTKEENWRFRAIHDWLTHISVGQPFTLEGELKAYNSHLKMFPKAAFPALFTEIVGQVCAQTVHGSFQEQKVCLLKGFDYENIGRVDGYLIKDKNLVKKS